MGFTDYKTLRETAKLIQTNLVDLAPVRTGNLRDKLRSYNTINRILGNTKQSGKKTKKYSIEADFEIDYSPPGATYGKWWNDPTLSRTIKNGKTKNIPRSINFADKALEASLTKEEDEIAEEFADKMADDVVIELELEIDNL